MKYNIRIKQRKKSHVIFHKKGGTGLIEMYRIGRNFRAFLWEIPERILGYMELSLRLNEVMIKRMIRICHCLQKNRACKTTV